MHILIVEDHYHAAIVLDELLQTYGHRCSIATNGKQAYEILEQKSIDGIVCDFSLPGENGGIFFLKVKEKWPHLIAQFVFLSGTSPEKIRSYVREHPLIFSKPMTSTAIKQIVALFS